MYMVPLMFMGMFMHVHACSCMLNSGCPITRGNEEDFARRPTCFPYERDLDRNLG